MADDLTLPAAGEKVATDEVAARHYQLIKLAFGADGSATLVSPADGLPVSTGGVTDAQMRASPVPVLVSDGSGPLTVDGTVSIAGNVAVTGPATDAQMRATPLAVSGPLTDAQLRATAVPVIVSDGSGPLTVDGTVAITAASLPLPTNAATEATLATVAAAVFATDAASSAADRGVVQLGVRRDNDGSTVGTDGDYEALQINAVGRLKVSAQPALAPLTVGNITANAQTVFCDTRRQSNVMAHVVATSLVGHNATFEGSIDSTNGTDGAWFAIQAIRSNANTIELVTGVLAATPAYAWELSVNGLAWIRVRATAHTSGTATWKFQPAPYATEPIPGAQVSGTQPVSGTVSAGLTATTARAAFMAAAGIWFDDTSTVLAANATFTGTARDATVTATATAHANAATYAQEVRACAEADQTGTLWLEISRDATTWRRIRSVATVAITGGGQAAEIIYRPSWRYWRIGFTNGATLQGRFTLGTMAMAG